MLTRAYTGHMYYGSPYETYDFCGNCDGAKCEHCRTVFELEEWDDYKIMDPQFQKFHDYDEAVEALRKYEAKAKELGYEIDETRETYLESYVKPKK